MYLTAVYKRPSSISMTSIKRPSLARGAFGRERTGCDHWAWKLPFYGKKDVPSPCMPEPSGPHSPSSIAFSCNRRGKMKICITFMNCWTKLGLQTRQLLCSPVEAEKVRKYRKIRTQRIKRPFSSLRSQEAPGTISASGCQPCKGYELGGRE